MIDKLELRALEKTHPAQIILAVVRGGARKIVLIPREKAQQTTRFGLPIEMLHGATYFPDGRKTNGVSVKTDQMVLIEKRGPRSRGASLTHSPQTKEG